MHTVSPVINASSPLALPSCRVVTDLAEAESLRHEWTDLAERTFRNELSISPDWLLTWWQVFGNLDGRQLRVGVFHQNDRLIGLAPLLFRSRRYRGVLSFRRLEFLGSGERPEHGIYSNHLSVLAETGAEEAVATALINSLQQSHFGPWDEVVLPMMDADTPMPRILAAVFRAQGFAVELTEIARAPYISLPATWDDYLESLSPNGRRNIRRSLKALESYADGEYRLESVNCIADLAKGKKILEELHHQRWEDVAQKGVFRLPHYLQFHDAIMRHLLERDCLLLTWLRAGDEPLAVLYGMKWAGKVYAYQLGRRIDVPGRLRPGATLLAFAIKQAIASGQKEFDLLADEVPFKQQLTLKSRPLLRLRVARPSLTESLRRAGNGCMAGLRWLGISGT